MTKTKIRKKKTINNKLCQIFINQKFDINLEKNYHSTIREIPKANQ